MRLPVIFFAKVLLILFCSLKASSQPRCSVLHYSTEDGLPDNRVMRITKDHEGFMWFGTSRTSHPVNSYTGAHRGRSTKSRAYG
ncbi:two-component regulator propeller domain-containing protein [Niastella sp. OAS944]|uniref:two-component regulator propeller domain-containing protein n=1 Tax=Niastella sp. OAS944 TaxID=2664089 RepID=UPI0035C7916F